jgi:hypothetical protein
VALRRFPLLLWRRGAGRGGRYSQRARHMNWCGNPLRRPHEPWHRECSGASSPQPSPPKEERENDSPVPHVHEMPVRCREDGRIPRTSPPTSPTCQPVVFAPLSEPDACLAA